MLQYPTVFALAAAALLNTATPKSAFFAQNKVAMGTMMNAMNVKPAGDIDADFVNMMEPHHRGAIDMAMLELRYGHNEQLHRIAQEIIVDQQQEIVSMRLALGRPPPLPSVSGDAALSAEASDHRPTSRGMSPARPAGVSKP